MTNDVALSNTDMIGVLQSSLYPNANPHSVAMVLQYCQAAGLDPMLKPVHIVPVWDRNSGGMRDVIMPGIGHYRIQASRSGEFAGMTEPEFGPDVDEEIGGAQITYPAWCKVTVKRQLSSGVVAEFTAVERWKENYAVKGGKEKSIAPNAMWSKRPYGQLAKCAEAQALRKAFPEIGAQPTADEMEGKEIEIDVTPPPPKITPNAGAWERMSPEHQAHLEGVAADVIMLLAKDENEKAVKRINDDRIADEKEGERPLDADEKLALWTRFDSKQRSALKKTAAMPTKPTYAQLEERMRAAKSPEERTKIAAESTHLPQDQGEELIELAMSLAREEQPA